MNDISKLAVTTRCKAMHAKGFSKREIANHFGISVPEVTAIIDPPAELSELERAKKSLLKQATPAGWDRERYKRCVLMNFGDA